MLSILYWVIEYDKTQNFRKFQKDILTITWVKPFLVRANELFRNEHQYRAQGLLDGHGFQYFKTDWVSNVHAYNTRLAKI